MKLPHRWKKHVYVMCACIAAGQLMYKSKVYLSTTYHYQKKLVFLFLDVILNNLFIRKV